MLLLLTPYCSSFKGREFILTQYDRFSTIPVENVGAHPKQINSDEFVKRLSPVFVILGKAGIQGNIGGTGLPLPDQVEDKLRGVTGLETFYEFFNNTPKI